MATNYKRLIINLLYVYFSENRVFMIVPFRNICNKLNINNLSIYVNIHPC
jgi:hypothetical protein